MKPMSLVLALRDFFGMLPGQSPASFMAEVKALNQNDRDYFAALLTGLGYTITPRQETGTV